METQNKNVHSLSKCDSFEDLFPKPVFSSDTYDGNRAANDETVVSGQVQQRVTDKNLDTADDTADFQTITEEEIESNFISYRPYIESCIKILDLIVFFTEFTSDQNKTFYKLSKSDPVQALRMAFDAIVEMKNIPNKYQLLLRAFDEAEYPKIVNLLRGLLIKVHDTHRQKLKSFAKDIYQRLSVCDILPYLLTKGVINHHDIDEIKSAEKNESRGSAVMQLLSILPNRSKDWFEYFLWALIQSKQKAIAVIIDKELTEKLEEADMFGIESPIAESSLQVSIKGLKKRLIQSKIISGIESKGLELIKQLEHSKSLSFGAKYSQKDQANASLPQKSLHESPYQFQTGDDSKNSDVHVNLDGEEDDDNTSGYKCPGCGPCSKKHSEVKAIQFCTECEENLCESCAEVHGRLKLTQEHKVVLIGDGTNQVPATDQQHNIPAVYCDCRQNHVVEVYCRSHHVVFCSVCRLTHHENCDTFIIEAQIDNILAEIEKATSETANAVNDRVAKLQTERSIDLTKLQCSKDVCRKQIMSFLNELERHLDALKNKAFEDLGKQEQIQTMRITDCITACQHIKQCLDYEKSTFQKILRTRDKVTLLDSYAKTYNYLSTIEKAIEKMQGAMYFCPINFERNQKLDIVKTAINKLGNLNCQTESRCLVETGSSASVNSEKPPEVLEGNSIDPAQVAVNLNDSMNIEASFLEPYYQSIQRSTETLEWELVDNV